MCSCIPALYISCWIPRHNIGQVLNKILRKCITNDASSLILGSYNGYSRPQNTGFSRGSHSLGTLPWLFLMGCKLHMLEIELILHPVWAGSLKIPIGFVQQGWYRVLERIFIFPSKSNSLNDTHWDFSRNSRHWPCSDRIDWSWSILRKMYFIFLITYRLIHKTLYSVLLSLHLWCR